MNTVAPDLGVADLVAEFDHATLLLLEHRRRVDELAATRALVMVQIYARGLTQRQVAARLNVSLARVSQLLETARRLRRRTEE